MRNSVTKSVFSKDPGRSYKHENFIKNGSDGVRAGVSFW